MSDGDKHKLRAFLGVRDWLYFVKQCVPPDEQFTMVRVDSVTHDVEYFNYRDSVTDDGAWVRICDGYMLDVNGLDNSRLLSLVWVIEMLQDFYG